MIVEDEESSAELEKDYLELSGFDVEVANDGLIGRTFQGSVGTFDGWMVLVVWMVVE